MEQFIACEGGIAGGAARCRNRKGVCSVKHTAPAPRPNVVLAKFGLDATWSESFAEMGVPIEDRTETRRSVLEVKHVVAAESLGRNAFAARPEGGRQTQERADSGSPVFGPNGLTGKRIDGYELVANELPAAGFVLTRYSILRRADKGDMLVLEFSEVGKKPAAEKFPMHTFTAFARGVSFNQIRLWANERAAHPDYPEGRCVHTVNCFNQLPKPPAHFLRYADGNWAFEPVPVPANAV